MRSKLRRELVDLRDLLVELTLDYVVLGTGTEAGTESEI